MTDLVLFWHRRDLRLSDNVGLSAARQLSSKVVGLFCLDPELLGRDDIAPARMTYLIGCLQALQTVYAKHQSQLLILHGSPAQAIPALAAALNAQAVFWNQDVEPYAKQRDLSVAAVLRQQGVVVQTFWDQILHEPEEIQTGSGSPYTVYTPFWKNWSRRHKAEPLPLPEKMGGLSETEKDLAQKAGAIDLPSAKDLGFVWDRPLVLEPGEDAARTQLYEFCDRAIFEYGHQRNFPGIEGTSRLSAALRFGTIGIRTIWATTVAAEQQCRSDEAYDSIRTWRQELAWREFYQHVMYFFPELADGPYRSTWKKFPWENNPDFFQAWCEGRTGYPIVDAAMRQLNQTGWMHNRCRMIVASFLTKDLFINWQWGEKYFMQTLIDGDLSSNNGGWQWSASSGMDPKPLRIFNPLSQTKNFDPEAKYIRQWLPELRSIDTQSLVTGKMSKSDCYACDYPMPIVDHNDRQRQFKALFKQTKAG
ncbi:MAG: FAD-binding domain-containing protein [Geitlerinemataceae cyanobacterium]